MLRVQATPAVSSTGLSPTVAAIFSANPTVGKGIVVVVLTATNEVPVVTDNKGNTYTLAKSTFNINTSWTVSIFYCSAIAATGASFTITATGVSANRVIQGIEVNDAITPDQSTSNLGAFPTPPSTGITPALTGAEVFVVAACNSSSTTFAVDATTPTWLQESEISTVGEIDSRSVSGAIGTTQTASWTLNGANYWNCALVAFKATVVIPPSVEIVQTVIII